MSRRRDVRGARPTESNPIVSGLSGPAAAALLIALVAFRLRPRAVRSVAPADHIERGSTHRHPLRSLRARRAERRPPSARAVAAWCDDLARQLRSGTSLNHALATTPDDPPTRRATDELRRRLERGRSVIDAVESAGIEGPDLRLALSVIATAARLGGSPAAAIDRTASTLRQRAADADERAVHAAQAQLSAHVLTVVPIAMLALLVVADGDVRAAASSPLGAACIVLGLALNATGSIWMRRIIGTRP
jgi:tight adherence protein B